MGSGSNIGRYSQTQTTAIDQPTIDEVQVQRAGSSATRVLREDIWAQSPPGRAASSTVVGLYELAILAGGQGSKDTANEGYMITLFAID